MSSLLLGFVSAAIVVAYTIQGATDLLFQPHALVIVFGGTFAVFFLGNSMSIVGMTLKGVGALFRAETSIEVVKGDLMLLAKKRNQTTVSRAPMIEYARELWEQGVDPDLFIVLLSQKRNELDHRFADAIQALKNLGKYPPALGMIGTVVGMLHLFNNLNSQKDLIGVNLAIAMTATFFGLTLSNLLISPLADRLQVRRLAQRRILDTCYEVLLLINRNDPAVLVEEEVRKRGA